MKSKVVRIVANWPASIRVSSLHMLRRQDRRVFGPSDNAHRIIVDGVSVIIKGLAMKQVSSDFDARIVHATDHVDERDRVIEKLRSENQKLRSLVVSLSQTVIRNVVAGVPTTVPFGSVSTTKRSTRVLFPL